MVRTIVLSLILLGIYSPVFSQDFNLPSPDQKKIKEQIESNYQYEGIYYYLTNNFNLINEKYDMEYYEWEKNKVCSFKLDFQNDIKYSIFQCKEAGGILVKVIFPKADKKNLISWVEQMYEIDKMNTDINVWKENDTKFEPSEPNPGCYYKVSETDKNTIVDLYCGC